MAGSETFVVVGGGLAAAKAVEGLREQGYDGRLLVLAAEAHLPYERPPLSKGYLLGTDELESAFVHTSEWYEEHGVALRLETTAVRLDVAEHTVETEDGSIRYDRLLLATGCTARRLPVADRSGAPVAYLRTIEDSRRIKDLLRPGRRVAIIGGGWIGLEVASAARNAGCEVAVLEALDKPLSKVLGPEVAEVFARLHTEHGVDLRVGVSVVGVDHDSGSAVVHLEGGDSVTADLLVVGIGVVPEAGLAEAAGLPVDNGVVVDEHLRTADPDVFAAGDVANAFHPRLGRHVRVEHWDNAIHQGLAAAASMLGRHATYDRLPYFFTDQYDLGIEYVGHVGPEGYDEVVLRGDVPGRVFTAFWVAGGRVLAGMHANDWDAIDPLRAVVEAAEVDLGRLRDPSVPLTELT